MENNENRKFINKLYLDPIESINTTKLKPKGYKIKGEPSKDNDKIKLLNSLPNLRINTNTSTSISKASKSNYGECYNSKLGNFKKYSRRHW